MAGLEHDARLAVFSIPSLRNIFLHLDAWRASTPFITDHQRRPFAQNPLRDLLDRALKSLDATQREVGYREATTLVMRDQAIIPLPHQVNICAPRRGLVFTPRRDEALCLSRAATK